MTLRLPVAAQSANPGAGSPELCRAGTRRLVGPSGVGKTHIAAAD